MRTKKQEFRFAVSFVGGTSLAIYMNGVAQELYRMAMATPDSGSDLYSVCLALTNSRRAKIDVLSGTSAGGINAILLAAAMANGTDLEITEQRFAELADIDALFHSLGDNPKSLLRGDDWVFQKLFEVFDGDLIPQAGNGNGIDWDLDLFVTGTYLTGHREIYRDNLGTEIELANHKGVFHFAQRGEKIHAETGLTTGQRRDLTSANNDSARTRVVKRLTNAARVTSSLPAVFEVASASEETFGSDSKIIDIEGTKDWMGDGGYLNLRPLDLVVDAIKKRKAGADTVVRKVLHVEPVPDLAQPTESENPPDALEHILAASRIGRLQSLRGVLDSVEQHNGKAREIIRYLRRIREAVRAKKNFRVEKLSRGTYREVTATQVGVEQANILKQDPQDVRVEPILEQPTKEQKIGMVILALERKALRATDEIYETKEALPEEEKYTAAVSSLGDTLEKLFGCYSAARKLRTDWADLVKGFDDERYGMLRKRAEAVSLEIDLLIAKAAVKVEPPEPEPDDDTRTVDSGVFVAIRWLKKTQSEEERLGIVARYLELLDTLLFPLEYTAGMTSRTRIDLVQLDPSARRGLADLEANQKLCGDQLSKYGGFLRAAWRLNDIYWGRLDSSARLVDVLLQDEARIKRVLENDQNVVNTYWSYLGVDAENLVSSDPYGDVLCAIYEQRLVDARDWMAGLNPSGFHDFVELLAVRHHLAILEKKLPRLIATEILEARKWEMEETRGQDALSHAEGVPNLQTFR